jgi:hypothetical protein
MQIGEATSGYKSVSSKTSTTVPVPAGEKWKFTTLGASFTSSASNDGSSNNEDAAVGITTSEGGEKLLSIGADRSTPPLGFTNDGGKTITVDGDTCNGLAIRNFGDSTNFFHWSAIRVS